MIGGAGLLGVIGGMGPFASAHFYKRLLELQKVEREQEQIDILIYSKASIPDRSAFILKQTEGDSPDSIQSNGVLNPLYSILEAGRVLESAGASLIAMPCVTAHFFYKDIVKGLRVPVINMAKETARRAASTGAKRVGLLATDGTVKGRVLHRELETLGAEAITLTENGRRRMMDFIYKTVKLGAAPDYGALKELSGELYGLGAEVIINGCTEISLAGREWHGGKNIDALEVLAETVVQLLGVNDANQSA